MRNKNTISVLIKKTNILLLFIKFNLLFYL
jgi:hypothetical protein